MKWYFNSQPRLPINVNTGRNGNISWITIHKVGMRHSGVYSCFGEKEIPIFDDTMLMPNEGNLIVHGIKNKKSVMCLI